MQEENLETGQRVKEGESPDLKSGGRVLPDILAASREAGYIMVAGQGTGKVTLRAQARPPAPAPVTPGACLWFGSAAPRLRRLPIGPPQSLF